MSCVRQKLEDKGVTGEPLQIILASWREGTQKQYRTYITAWISFCTEHGTNFLQPSHILDFLTAQSKRLGYSADTARSALSSFITVDGCKAGEHPIVSRLMSGIFNRNPALPRYVETWDPQVVLSYLKTFPQLCDMTLKELTLKVTMLFALVTAQRLQTLKAFAINHMQLNFTRRLCISN